MIIDANDSGRGLDRELLAWLDKISVDMLDKLAAAGLIAKRESATLGAFVGSYIDSARMPSRIQSETSKTR